MACVPGPTLTQQLARLVGVPEGTSSFVIRVEQHGNIIVDCTFRPEQAQRALPVIPQPGR